MNDELHQEIKRDNLIFAGFAPSYSEMVAREGGNNRRHVSVEASINSVVTYCQKMLAMPEITVHDILSVFLSTVQKSLNRRIVKCNIGLEEDVTTKCLAVWYMLCAYLMNFVCFDLRLGFACFIRMC
jgi:hypothetical protein